MSTANAKQKIILTTIRMVQEKGYGNISTNHIADEAGVSIGTLYYHFPDGKPSILYAIAEEGFKKLMSSTPPLKLDLTIIENLRTSKAFHALLTSTIKAHRAGRPLLAAMESEYLTNDKLVQQLIEDFGVDEPSPLVGLFKQIVERQNLMIEDFDEKANKIINVIEALIHRHVLFPHKFRTDTEFIEILKVIIVSLVKLYFEK